MSLSRRSFLRSATATLAAAPILTEAHFARAAALEAGVPEFTMQGIYLDANENPLGPCEHARKAIADIIPNGGRYAPPLYFDLMKLYAEQILPPGPPPAGPSASFARPPGVQGGFVLPPRQQQRPRQGRSRCPG